MTFVHQALDLLAAAGLGGAVGLEHLRAPESVVGLEFGS
jgi:hypothetical protein